MKSSVAKVSLPELLELARQARPISGSRLRIVFGPSSLLSDRAFCEALQEFPGQDLIIGCSTAGEIRGATVDENSISLATMEFAKTELALCHYQIKESEDSFSAGYQLAKDLKRPDLKAVLVFSDGLNVNGSQLVAGFNAVFEGQIPVTGGLAADDARFKTTWVLQRRQPRTGAISAVGFYGDHVVVSHGSKGGWGIFGPERLITRSKGNVLYDIDGQPALDLYRKYLGDKAKDLPGSALLYPMQVWKSGRPESAVVRTILGVDEKNKSMIFAGDMPEGYSAQLMRANVDRLVDGAAQAAAALGATGQGLSLAVSCVGRKLVLGSQVDEEVEAAMEVLPKGAQQIGFYSYGEISPLAGDRVCLLHNQTMSLTYITEKDLSHAA